MFRKPVPSDVTIVNSAVITYSFRPGVVTTTDFEFELLVHLPRIEKAIKRFGLWTGDSEFIEKELDHRRKRARPWHAPKPLNAYDLYRDRTSIGYVHMLVQKAGESDGRERVCLSAITKEVPANFSTSWP